MKKALTRVARSPFYIKDGVRIEGVHDRITGDVSRISGDVSNISGNIDDCDLTEKDRDRGISINDLIQ